ncbi:MAG: 3-deoxy-D-manno-octulosonic acid transferase [Curvibacter sp.]|jgi:3-deoxy-D-manno-octulosonic-acid transferase
MVRVLYSLLMRTLQPLLRRKLARRVCTEPGYGVAVEERFGRYSSPALPDDGRTVWVHAVSLGETRAAAVLLRELRARWPDVRLLLTHGTATGRAEGASLLREGDVQVWQPWDTPEAAQRFLAHFRPRLGILLETEVWPNLAAACAAAAVPLVLANARLSEKSLRGALRVAWLSRPTYRRLAAVWAQTEDDAQRLRQLDAPVRGVFGNLKFDATPDPALLERGRDWRAALGRPVVMFASSREGEEADLLQALHAERDAARSVHWLIVPRHPQRFDEVADLITRDGWTLARRSTWGELLTQVDLAADVWLGDTLGEMPLYYGLSDVALLGGSFAPLGGQNLIEAAACSCPVFLGPHTFNFEEAANLALEAGAAVRCADMAAAVRGVLALVREPGRQDSMARASRRFARDHRGAVARTCKALADYLP